MVIYLVVTLLLTFLGLGAVILITYYIAIAIIRRPVPIDLTTKRIVQKGMSLDYRTCTAIALQIAVGKQVGYSLLFSFPNNQYWTYRLTDNHANTERVRSNKQVVAAMVDEMSGIPQTLHDVVEVNRFLGSLFGRQLIHIGSSEAKRYLYASRGELIDAVRLLKKHR